ncbi:MULTISPECIES: glycosyltransferase family 2 protein [Burkholderia]|jgi:O-antigen biosynthesis protein|uniref:Glycosyltransferase family 2 protein n=4 Tax=Burkholderia contaminans TaxID=488447 RepID=A0AAP1YEG6_9BURK|nr:MULTISPECIES: glycosyltransferase family 2 protein [Burkholderia]UTP21514.1 glycosyltransferase family 2 protein [Burkholderia sp. FXe9]MBA9836866.1 glycosyltransferase [Burkholderia contaminans]MBA9863250.1 glycosyltransferase [Burkholderia contaminans]MBA9904005.1 glycosyltransferase [Burkholderia contaminans]MBA9928433.1 glycosyltransferase [Burkholderia contaminans]
MFDINALRLTWGMPFLADLPDTETHVSADRPRFRAYLVNVQLLPGWYMIELRVNGQAAMVRARLRLHARSSFTTLAMELSSQQLSKRLIRLPERGRIEIEIDLDDRSVDRVEMFRLIRVTKRFARSRIMAKLESLHPKYKPCGEDYDLADIFHSCADMEQAWRDYCCLFDESELVGYPDWVRHFDTPSSDTYRVMKDNLRHFATCPVFAIGMEVSDVPSPHLEAAIRSVSAQIYPHWKLLVVDRRSSSDSSELIPRDLRADSRIRVISGQSSTETHSTLDRKLAESGSWVVFLGQRDVLPQHGLYVVADSINRRPDVDLIYSDEDCIDVDGIRHSPRFKSDWNEDLMLSLDLFTGLGAYRAEVFASSGGRNQHHGAASNYDMTLRCLSHTSRDRILHIPRVLYHTRAQSDSIQDPVVRRNARDASRMAVVRHLSRAGVQATVSSTDYGRRIQYLLPEKVPLVTLVIPTRNGLELLSRCVDSIIEKTRYRAFEIIIVDNGSDDPETLDYMERLSIDHGVSILRDDRPFNYSALNNRAIDIARGEFVALVNNDVEVIDGDWLDEVMGHALRPEVGVVGVKLLYSNGTVQHAGVIVGLSGCADHLHRGLGRDEPGYQARAVTTQSLSAVTGACLVVRRSLYLQLGGLNEHDLAVAFNDVDFCLRVRQAGYKVLWTPHAVLYHHESATRGRDDTVEKIARANREIDYMRQHWPELIANDPAYNPNLSLDQFDCQLAWPPRVASLRRLALDAPGATAT